MQLIYVGKDGSRAGLAQAMLVRNGVACELHAVEIDKESQQAVRRLIVDDALAGMAIEVLRGASLLPSWTVESLS